jgi:antitoxin HicB
VLHGFRVNLGLLFDAVSNCCKQVKSLITSNPVFTVVLEPDIDGGFTVRVPALPEIVSWGADEDEALAMAQDAIRLVVEDSAARGEPPV